MPAQNALPVDTTTSGPSPGHKDWSAAEVYGGYSYLNVDTNGLTARQSMNGWETGIAGNFNRWFAAEAEFAGYYKTLYGGSASDYSYLAGPRFNFRPVFLRVLIGGDHLGGSVAGISGSQDGLAAAAGGGVQWRFASRFSLRTSVDYVLSRHNILGGSSVTQNNVRASVGIVFHFGRSAATAPHFQSSSSSRESRVSIGIPALGIRAGLSEAGGAEIVEIVQGGVAELSGLRVGDVINAIDGKAVNTPMELTAALSDRQPGTKVSVGFLVRGHWQSESVVLLGEHRWHLAVRSRTWRPTQSLQAKCAEKDIGGLRWVLRLLEPSMSVWGGNVGNDVQFFVFVFVILPLTIFLIWAQLKLFSIDCTLKQILRQLPSRDELREMQFQQKLQRYVAGGGRWLSIPTSALGSYRGDSMPVLYLSAPMGRTQQGSSGFFRTFQTIVANGIGPDYAIYSALIAQIHSGVKVVVFDRDQQLRAEGTLAGYLAKGKAGNGVRRYDLQILNLHPVPYISPPPVNHCGVALI
jgi:hypothetical protein